MAHMGVIKNDSRQISWNSTFGHIQTYRFRYIYVMSKKLKYILGVIVVGGMLYVGVTQYMLYETKKYSPEAVAEYNNNQVTIQVKYSRPSRKGRDIFGSLVPYGRWWRTGANEATQMTISNDIVFSGKTLAAGKYSIVTIPNENEWIVIFNSKIPDWGTNYSPEYDALRVTAPVENLPETVEFFTIDFTEDNGSPSLIMAWDKTKVSVPFSVL